MRYHGDRNGSDRTFPTIAFLLIGGQHQMLHLAPVAAAIARRGAARVTAFVRNAADMAALQEIWSDLPAEVAIEQLPLPLWARPLRASAAAADQLKSPRLVASRARLATFDLVVAAERTSTVLKRLPGARPYLVHIPHGAGDRAQGFEPRIALFDHVIVAGRKDRDRMIGEGLVRPQDCSTSGYIKLAAVQPPGAPRRRLFDNDRPTILYNPHFSPNLSSWQDYAEHLIRQVVQDDAFNLIVAPHVRLQGQLPPAEQAYFAAKAVPGRVIVDFGSVRSNDMSYTEAADIYVGDVSSQVYEFVSRPRPCVFLNAGAVPWENDPSFACWSFGEVVDDPDETYAAIRRAADRHGRYVGRQQQGAQAALGPSDGMAVDRAADMLMDLAERRLRGSVADAPIMQSIQPRRAARAAVAAATLVAAVAGGLAVHAAITADASSASLTAPHRRTVPGMTELAALTKVRSPLIPGGHL